MDMFDNQKTVKELKKSFLKWAGGKRKLVPTIMGRFPKQGKRFIDVFAGSGVVALNADYPKIIYNDFNTDLYLIWQCLQKYGQSFINECKEIFTSKNNTKEMYYKLRDEFNRTKIKRRKAVLFIYLNRYGFNGLCRYNAKGGFNVPIGRYKKPYFPENELTSCLRKVVNWKLCNKDFRDIFKTVKDGDVVYCDPPYLPLSDTSDFTSYSAGGFSLQDQIDLAKCASKAAQKGAIVVISNHDTWCARQIYGNMFNRKISSISVSRTISSNADSRKPVKEVIVVFTKDKGN